MAARQKLPEDLQQLFGIIRSGRLFALQKWLADSKRLRDPNNNDYRTDVLRVALETGFHSVVEVLLNAGGWSDSELTEGAELALEYRRRDLADLFLSRGAKLDQIRFDTICKTMDLALMEQFLRAGGDPSHDNGFAYALSHIKARPLLRFYRSFRGEFPALDDQAALALDRAVQANEVRWTALLAWAGADPFRPVPYNDSDSFPVDPEDSTNAAMHAIYQKNAEILKVLHLKPSPTQAIELLTSAAYNSNVEVFKAFLGVLKAEQLNDSPRGSCSALEQLVRRCAYRSMWSPVRGDEGDAENLKCVEMLLDAGAKWNPEPKELKYSRRSILEHNSRYVVQLLRLLLYTPNAVDIEGFLELCRSQTLMAKIAETDHQLVGEIKLLSKGPRTKTINGSGEAPSKETVEDSLRIRF